MDTVCCPAPLSGGLGLEGWVSVLLRRVRGAWLAALSALDAAGECRDAAYEGENAARVLDSYGNAILRLAYTYMHSMSDAEDILQETLIRYLTKAPRFESAAHEKAWLLRVAANLSKSRLEYERIRRTDELEEELAAEEREDLSFVWEAVKALPVKQREAVHLFYHEGCSTAQIAKILDRNESSVRSDLRRGRERLKAILKEEYDYDRGI